MSQWKNIVSMMVLSGAAALAGTGCLAQGADDEAADDHVVAPAGDHAATGAETTGDAKEACGCGFWGGIGCGSCGGWAGGFLGGVLSPWIGNACLIGGCGGCW
jgi:hypothetical protein